MEINSTSMSEKETKNWNACQVVVVYSDVSNKLGIPINEVISDVSELVE